MRNRDPEAYEKKKETLRNRYKNDPEYREKMKKRSHDYYHNVLKDDPYYKEACKAYYQNKIETGSLDKLKVSVKPVTTWQRAVDAARLTSNKPPLGHEPSTEWKKKAILSEHSPIRLLEFDIKIECIPSWVSVHLVRHFLGVEKFVTTQRDDRCNHNVPRSQLPQGTLVDMQMSCNAQALINISRKRLCMQASNETRKVWEAVKQAVTEVDPVVGEAMVRECIYKGWCYEMRPCGYTNTDKYQQELINHRQV